MHIAQFSGMNIKRCESKKGFNHVIDGWSLSDWMTALIGEVGEAANVIKKLNRVRDGIRNKKGETEEQLRADLADELADAYTYLDLLATAAGLDLEKVVLEKFDKVSAEIGYVQEL